MPIDTWPAVFRFDEPQSVALRAASTDDMTKVGQKASEILTEKQIISSDQTLSYRSEDLMEQAEQLQQLSNSPTASFCGSPASPCWWAALAL